MNTIVDKPYVEMGNKNEELFLPLLKTIYGTDLERTNANKWAENDYISKKNNVKIEMKSRTCYSYSFPTTMLGANKLREIFQNFNMNYVFIFVFLDGVYSWTYSDENYELAGGKDAVKVAGTNERGYDDYKYHFFIPIKHLKKISDKGCYVPDALLCKCPKPHGVCLLKINK